MKRFMITTALASGMALAATAQTMDTAPATGTAASQVPAFMASDFTGMTLYTLSSAPAEPLEGGPEAGMPEASMDGDAMEGADMTAAPTAAPTATASAADPFADRDSWESVGNIDDVVLTPEGEIRGVLVDVGGFLGLFGRTVMIDFAELAFHADPDADDPSSFVVFISMTEEALEALPEWDEAQLEASIEWQTPPDQG